MQGANEIPRNFSIACISYGLYDKLKCKYFDPPSKEFPVDTELFRILSRDYYMGLKRLLPSTYKNKPVFKEWGGGQFYKIPIRATIGDSREILCNLLLSQNIERYAETDMIDDLSSFKSIIENNDKDIYIDNDGVGISIESNMDFL